MTWRAGVVGSPITHSMSPVLHRAAYDALGLEGWSFHRDQVEAGDLAAYVEGLPGDWVGLAVTMPLKEEALALATHVGPEARLVGGANTLLRRDDGWHGENTDVHGLEQALRAQGLETASTAAVIGSGATARSALLTLSRFGVSEVTLIVRDQVRPGALELADELGLRVTTSPYAEGPASWGTPGVVVNTVPAGGTPPVDGWSLPVGAVVFDVVYAGWPTPWATEWNAQGVSVGRGDAMLLHQGVRQVELMTGHDAPVVAMAAALAAAVDARP
ncbi:shikimate dehydrogenase [Ornithinimicrobium faecis]|uniref:Shikimate dehydrogenase n=1 Tax=Ornithinimicrobium faecis TaxID=2934158 RepID=A0ABY4YNI9_9MICO|nr:MULTISPECIES: shikimate dehydrogenase [unclassified Ornithinimicrobium]USQ78355.1 shikimate dehydrogenase [Ornithinimicrobium sp. HY1793]